MRLNFDTLFSKYLTKPWSEELSFGEKILATISLIAFTILTIGLIFPLTSSLRNRNIKKFGKEEENTNKEINKTQYVLKHLPGPLQHLFSNIDSTKLIEAKGKAMRDDFLSDPTYRSTPPVISCSEFVPKNLVEHLMRDKRDSACGSKYIPGSRITNMEGAMHTFVTPVTAIRMTGDYRWAGTHTAAQLKGKLRPVVMSAAIHPDFEFRKPNSVTLAVVSLNDEEVSAQELPDDFVPLSWKYPPDDEKFKNSLPEYEKALRDHMIYHLTRRHAFPSSSQIGENAMNPIKALEFIETVIEDKYEWPPGILFEGQFVNLSGQIVSLEALYNSYRHQIRNEFSVLEGTLPQGYVYLIDPPSIFANAIGVENVAILNRLQLIALIELHMHSPLDNLKVIGFNDYKDPGCLALYRREFSDKEVTSKANLFRGDFGTYSGKEPYALVEHNNSDGFGQNIETEGATSKDGVIGVYSDAAHHLKRDRRDLLDHIV